ncbi:chaperone protein dnaJ [Striga asiatica]|uniref:Chaperone protein dnaJ n=1 Tax=Striga asiatica TaxID=4170 RepID=A0A5A7PJM6_STRAF|nr:chaperone protein dnaJ [Striga asiatica]
MKLISLCHNQCSSASSLLLFKKINSQFIDASKSRSSTSSSPSSSLRMICNYGGGGGGGENSDYSGCDFEPFTASWAYAVLGLDPQCSSAQLKAAFRSKVKQCHPDVTRGEQSSDTMIRHVIQAYEEPDNFFGEFVLEEVEREFMNPFDQPECEACDIFVNGSLCIGQSTDSLHSKPCCPYSCVRTAPHAFKFSSETGRACAASQVHLAVGQCPRSCIHYVTPSQRIILEELLDSIVNVPYDTSAEAELLYGLIVKAKYENNRYQVPKEKAKASNEHVDWL